MKKRICLIETDDHLRFLLKKALNSDGYSVEDYSNPYPLFDVNRVWPDAFIIETELKSINGLEICRWIKSNEESAFIPVILLYDSPELEVLASNTKADFWMRKPVDMSLMLKVLHQTQHLTVL